MTMIWCRAMDDDAYTKARIKSDEWFEAGISVFDCKPVSGKFPNVTLEVTSPHPPGDFFEPGTIFTISERLKAVLEEFEVRAEFFPVRIVYRGQEYTTCSYYFCNILDCVDCLDLARGEYIFESKPGFTHIVGSIQKMVIDDAKAAGHDLFRIGRGGEANVAVSDRVASRIEDEKLKGLVMKKPEDWKFGM